MRNYQNGVLLADKSGVCQFINEKDEVASTQLKGDHLTCLRANPVEPTQVAFGSKGTTVQLWSLADSGSLSMLWQAKNVPNDSLDL